MKIVVDPGSLLGAQSVTVQVVDDVVETLEITPANPPVLPVGSTQQLRATGTFESGDFARNSAV